YYKGSYAFFFNNTLLRIHIVESVFNQVSPFRQQHVSFERIAPIAAIYNIVRCVGAASVYWHNMIFRFHPFLICASVIFPSRHVWMPTVSANVSHYKANHLGLIRSASSRAAFAFFSHLSPTSYSLRSSASLASFMKEWYL